MIKSNSTIILKLLPTLALAVILVFSLLIRVINLETVPSGLQADEASFLLNTSALLKTGKDEDNTRFPLYLSSLIDSKPALYSYLQASAVAVLGPTTAASRVPSAVLGTASIFLWFLLVKRVLKSTWLGVAGALFLALSPWHIMNSRATQEVILSFFFMLANLLAFHALLTQKKKLDMSTLLLFAATGMLAMYSYHAVKIVLLGFYLSLGVGAVILKFRTENSKKLYLSAALMLLAFIITAGSAVTRFSAIGILHDDLPKAQIFEITTAVTGSTPLLLVRMFYNKIVFYLHYAITQYFAHFDLNFLFVTGGATKRFSVPYHGLFYLLDSALILAGAHHLLTRKKYQVFVLPILLLILISPLPAALTTEEIPSSIRSFSLLIPLSFLLVLAIEKLLSSAVLGKLRWMVLSGLTLGYIWSAGFFFQELFVAMPLFNTTARNRQYEVVAEYLVQPENRDRSVTFTNDLREGYIYLWLNDLITLTEIQAQPLARYSAEYTLGKYTFQQAPCDNSRLYDSELIVAPASCQKSGKIKLPVVFEAPFDDGKPGFTVFATPPKVPHD